MVLIFENKAITIVKRLSENLYDYLRKVQIHVDITIGSCCMEDNTRPGLGIRKTCREAEELMKNVFFHHGKKIIFIGAMQIDKKHVTQFDISDKAKELVSYIHTINSKKLSSFFARLEAYFYSSGKSPLEVRQDCMVLMIEARNDIFRKIPALKEKLGSGKEILDIIMGHRYLSAIIKAMTEACVHISENMSFLSTDARLQRVVSYVENNYSEKLNLKSVAGLFYYNCAYLGKSFKKHTGKSFNEYLDTLRVDAAKKLLMSTDMKVYEISAAIGYTNTDYFHGKFKKYAGESPLALRKKSTLVSKEN
ncbi:MAG: helix-turn-helix domain-containing protein [Treponema sp.]|nr:helix-turn-helix domain-containing protein [Treponema sp.]